MPINVSTWQGMANLKTGIRLIKETHTKHKDSTKWLMEDDIVTEAIDIVTYLEEDQPRVKLSESTSFADENGYNRNRFFVVYISHSSDTIEPKTLPNGFISYYILFNRDKKGLNSDFNENDTNITKLTCIYCDYQAPLGGKQIVCQENT
jgi:hypothetical protein